MTASVDHVSIATPPGKRDIRVKVKINGVEAGTFLVDTGATAVTTTAANADANLGLEVAGGRKVRLQTAHGGTRRRGSSSRRARSTSKASPPSASTSSSSTTSAPTSMASSGLSYLSHFDIRKDAGAFEIRTRSAKPADSAAP